MAARQAAVTTLSIKRRCSTVIRRSASDCFQLSDEPLYLMLSGSLNGVT